MKITQSYLAQQILKNSGGTFLLRLVATGAAFPVQVMLTRTLGEVSFGEYIYTRAWVLTLAVFAQLGLPLSAVRFVAEYVAEEEWGLVRGFVKRGTEILLLASCGLVLFGLGIIWWGLHPYEYVSTHQAILFSWASLILPVTVLQTFYMSVLRGNNQVLTAIGIGTFTPIIIALSIWLLDMGNLVDATGQSALAIYAVVTAIAVSTQLIVMRLSQPHIFDRGLAARYEHKKWFGMSSAVFSTSSIQTLIRRFDILVVGTFLGTTQAGIFSVAKELVRLSSFGLQITNSASAHFFSQLYKQNRLDDLRRTVTATALLTFITAFPIILILALYPDFLLGLFGKSFVAANGILLILLIGELFNGITGPNGVVLNMTGHHYVIVRITIIILIIDLILMWALTSYFGVIGAAIATAVTVAVRNIGLTWLTWKKIKVNTTIFSRQTWTLLKLVQKKIVH